MISSRHKKPVKLLLLFFKWRRRRRRRRGRRRRRREEEDKEKEEERGGGEGGRGRGGGRGGGGGGAGGGAGGGGGGKSFNFLCINFKKKKIKKFCLCLSTNKIWKVFFLGSFFLSSCNASRVKVVSTTLYTSTELISSSFPTQPWLVCLSICSPKDVERKKKKRRVTFLAKQILLRWGFFFGCKNLHIFLVVDVSEVRSNS